MFRASLLAVFLVVGSCYAGAESFTGLSKPGGAGHALLFRDHVLVKKDFKSFPSTDLTFEAWVSTSDFCHQGAIVSYAKDSKSPNPDQRISDFNHFVIFDAKNLLACHDFQFIDLKPDPEGVSCHSQFNKTANFVERDGTWHHLAVTWTTKNNGYTEVYKDGVLMGSAQTGKKEPLVPNGAFIIGGEQDCFGGCTDPDQAFYGMMDEVRIWKTVRTQQEILKSMRVSSGLEGHADLIAYWKFNEPDEDTSFLEHTVARDSSGMGNDLSLVTPPKDAYETIIQRAPGKVNELHTGSLGFKNNFAIKKDTSSMPEKSFSVEFWARGKKLDSKTNTDKISEFISFAAEKPTDGAAAGRFMDDAIRIQRYLEDYSDNLDSATSTVGAVSVHINSNAHTDSFNPENWIDFAANWTDDQWHHIAVTWTWETGETKLYMDGESKPAFWKSDAGSMEDRSPKVGGVDNRVAAMSTRSAKGSLVIGMDQDCYGGCFSPTSAFDGSLAVVRIWSRVLDQKEVQENMFRDHPSSTQGLSALYIFDNQGLRKTTSGHLMAIDLSGNKNDLDLRSNPPQYIYSSAPLTDNNGAPLEGPKPGAAGYALSLNDEQVTILTNFQDFPATALTLEFWMLSVDRCRPGVPFSYAAGQYETMDNAFLLFNYNSWGVSVLEDEGTTGDHQSGLSATDGTWHHIAVTWDSKTGNTVLYDNGKPVWTVKRSKGRSIPSGGTLVLGREQDCMGGCFDSADGAAGKVDPSDQQQYSDQGPQDFFGLVEEMRLWKVVRTPEQIIEGIKIDNSNRGDSGGGSSFAKDERDLVAYWKFDEPGYLIKDHSGHGHDLHVTSAPKFEVVKWLSSCGNGILEDGEECDDGDRHDGNGCSAQCKVEAGWECHGSPSVCRKRGGGGKVKPAPGPTPGSGSHSKSSDDAHPSGGGSSSSSSGHKRAGMSGGAIALTTICIICSFAGLCVAYTKRREIMRAPQVQAGVRQLRNVFERVLPGNQYRNLAIDPEELDVSPEFLAPMPARTAPGHHGSYVPLPFTPGST